MYAATIVCIVILLAVSISIPQALNWTIMFIPNEQTRAVAQSIFTLAHQTLLNIILWIEAVAVVYIFWSGDLSLM